MINPPRYSVILPVYHGGEFLAKAIKSLTDVNSPPGGFEVIIAGQKEKMKGINEFDLNERGWQIIDCGGNHSERLNAACASAQGRIWVFSDDDCIFPPEWLIEVEKSLRANPDALVLGGADILAPGASGFDLALDVVLNSLMGTGGTRTNQNLKAGEYYPKLWNMAVLAHAARSKAVDYPDSRLIFNPALCVHEDVDLVDRIGTQGGKVAYSPYVRVFHSRDTTFVSFALRNMAMARICGQKGIHRTPHLVLATAFVGGPVLIVASAIIPALKILWVSVYGLYIAIAMLTGVKGALEKKRTSLILLVPVLIISMHIARAVGYVSSLNFRRGETI